jgi:hypothetical protein
MLDLLHANLYGCLDSCPAEQKTAILTFSSTMGSFEKDEDPPF